MKTIVLEFRGAHFGGRERFLHKLVQGLDRRTYRPVLLGCEEGEVAAFFRDRGEDVQIVLEPEFRAFLRRTRPALVQSCSYRPSLGMATRAEKIPHVWRIAGHLRVACSPFEHPRALLIALSATASAIVCPSRFLSSQLTPWYRGELRIIPNAVHCPATSASLPKHPRLGTIGHPIAHKRIEVFVDAMGHLVRERGPLACVVYGRSLESGYDRRLQERARARNVALEVEEFAPEDLDEALAALSLVAVPGSLDEGFGNAAWEAMGAQRPVVAVDSGAYPEWIEHERNALLFPPDDDAALARQLARLLDDPALAARLALCGRELVRERFSQERCMHAYHQLYDELTSQV